MPVIDPAWAGKVAFYELLFGSWLAYVFLALMWERALREPLAEWRYVLLNFLGAGAFWINHYFQKAPLWFAMLNAYTALFLLAWWWVGIHGHQRSIGWKIAALLGAVAYTIAFIGFEQLSRVGVDRYGVHEFWFMAASFFGFIAVILWRGPLQQKGTGP
ncbi:MAG: hypothetical protein OEW88_07870 [Gammaproteobacteria bacterium]|nr:hypothetical protein [Gammaproteobacteria bacterium]MDH5276326.1 hypothetical protein [Gammaproteobacteria bacterium]